MRLLLLILITVFSLTALLLLRAPPTSHEASTFLYKLNVTLTNNGTQPMPLEGLTLITIFPNSSRQRVLVERVSYYLNGDELNGYSFQKSPEGNTILNLTGAPAFLPPRSCLRVYLELSINLQTTIMNLTTPLIPEESQLLDDIPAELKEKFCNSTDLWNTQDPELSRLASSLSGDERVLNVIYNFLTWIDDNIKYPSEREDTEHIVWYPNQTYVEREGDCDDRANLFITLCRCVGIPSYLQYGAIYEPGSMSFSEYFDSRYRHIMYGMGRHGWAMSYVPPWGWLPIDFTYFEGLSLVGINGSLYLKASKPSDHIIGSALFTDSVIVEGNITVSDYMASNLKIAELLASYDAYMIEEEALLPHP